MSGGDAVTEALGYLGPTNAGAPGQGANGAAR
jgi:hypothetical protein